MSKLFVLFPKNPEANVPLLIPYQYQIKLEASIKYCDKNDDSMTTTVDTATINAVLQNNDHATVYRANLNDGSDVVLKFALNNSSATDLEKEAQYYIHKLESLQGSVVPKFKGLFNSETQSDPKKVDVSCMLLEYCGTPVDKPFNTLPREDRWVILLYCTNSISVLINVCSTFITKAANFEETWRISLDQMSPKRLC